MRAHFRGLALSASVGALSTSYVVFQSRADAAYTFASLADTKGTYSSISNAPTVNAGGTVAFIALRKTTVRSLQTVARDGSVTTIADTSGAFHGFAAYPVGINDSGAVAFLADLDNATVGIYKGDGVTTTAIAEDSGPLGGFDYYPSIANNGSVLFSANIDAGGSGYFVGASAPAAQIPGIPGFLAGTGRAPCISRDGTKAIIRGRPVGSSFSGIYLVDVVTGAYTSIIDFGGGDLSSITGFPSMNSSGAVAFHAMHTSGEDGIYVAAGGTSRTVATTAGPYSVLYGGGWTGPSINAAGTVAFEATLDAGGDGIFTGPDPIADKVIATGDPLFGATVSSISFTNAGIDDFGDIAFGYTLDNGVSGIAMAYVPEPTNLALCAVVLIGSILRRRRRHCMATSSAV